MILTHANTKDYRVKVFLDGKEFAHVMRADTEAGTIDVAIADIGCVRTLRGHVRVEMTPRLTTEHFRNWRKEYSRVTIHESGERA